jgi:hypothetical protein
MQTTQYALRKLAVVVLHKVHVQAGHFRKVSHVEALIKKHRASPKTLGSRIRTSGVAVCVMVYGMFT